MLEKQSNDNKSNVSLACHKNPEVLNRSCLYLCCQAYQSNNDFIYRFMIHGVFISCSSAAFNLFMHNCLSNHWYHRIMKVQ